MLDYLFELNSNFLLATFIFIYSISISKWTGLNSPAIWWWFHSNEMLQHSQINNLKKIFLSSRISLLFSLFFNFSFISFRFQLQFSNLNSTSIKSNHCAVHVFLYYTMLCYRSSALFSGGFYFSRCENGEKVWIWLKLEIIRNNLFAFLSPNICAINTLYFLNNLRLIGMIFNLCSCKSWDRKNDTINVVL